MSTSITFNGVGYTIPAEGDNYGDDLSSYLVAIASGALQKTGGTFTLSAEVNFGATYGLKSVYLKSQASNPASTGIIRLGNTEAIGWRNAANNADLSISVNASNKFTFNSIELADISSVQTLTNKTLTAPVISSPTGLVKADVGLGNVDNTSDATKNAAAVTLTNKTIDAASNTISNIANANVSASAAIAYSKLNLATSIVNADISASAAIAYSKLNLSTSILNADINASAAIARTKLSALTTSRAMVTDGSGFDSVSAVTSTELGYVSGVTSAIQTQLNAKISNTLTTTTGDMIYASGANTPARLPIGSAGQVIKSVGGVPTWATFSGGINYLSSNPDAEADVSGWSTYADAAGANPVDGTGGTPNSTWTRTTSSPLRGSGSFLFTKNSGASRQGEGVSYAFSIDTSDKAKVIQINFDYIIASGTFVPGSSGVDSDLTVWIYDVTNAVLIQPSNYKLLSNSTNVADKFSASFQSASNSTSYRLIIHKGTTATAAFTAQFDNFNVGPSNYVFGSPITDWQSVTMTGNLTTNTVYTAKRARVGDSYKYNVQVSFTGTPNAAGVFALDLPAGDVIDTSKLSSGGSLFNFDSNIEGRVGISAGSAYEGGVMLNSTTSVVVSWFDTNGNGNYVAHNSPAALAIGHTLNIEFTVPIVGLSSSVQMSDSSSTRTVSVFKIPATPTGTINGGYNAVVWSSASVDTHGGYNSGTGRYTVAVPGYYSIAATLDINGTFTVGQYIGVRAGNVTTGDYCYNFWKSQGSTTGDYPVCVVGSVYAKAGDVLGVDSISSGSTLSYSGSLSNSHFAFNLQQGPSAIAASEKIYAIYKTGSGPALGVGTTIIDYSSSEADSHGLVTTGASWKFTSPRADLYLISGAARISTALRRLDLYKNGSFVRALCEPSGIDETVGFNTAIQLNAGDYIDIRANTGSSASLYADDRFNYIIVKSN